MALRRWPALAMAIALASTAHAQSGDETGAFLGIETHGFVSQGFLLTTDNNYLAESEQGSFEFTEVGINFTKQLGDDLRVGVQLFARDLGLVGNYSAKFDWYYLDYRYRDWLGFRAGRVKLPFGLYNEIHDIDSARVPVLLPGSVYSIQNRDALLAQTGVELYGRLGLGSVGAVEYNVYGGTIFLEVQPLADASVSYLNIPYVVGGRVLWETPLPGLRVGGSMLALQLESTLHYEGQALEIVRMAYGLPDTFTGDIELESPLVMWVGSIEYALDDLLRVAEYSRQFTHIETNFDAPLLEAETTAERTYVMATYRVSDWLHPGVYYALSFPDVEKRSGKENQQHDLAATLRFDLTANWLVKLEGHYMVGTAALDMNLNDRKPNSTLDSPWGLFLIKTTAYF